MTRLSARFVTGALAVLMMAAPVMAQTPASPLTPPPITPSPLPPPLVEPQPDHPAYGDLLTAIQGSVDPEP